MLPLLVTQLFHLGGGTWASLGGFSAAVADRGGAYRIRARTMGALTIGAAGAVVVAGLAGANDVVAVLLTFVVVGVLSLAREFGISAGGVGTSIAIAFVISLSVPSPSGREALMRGVFLLAGGAWAMTLALVFWPLRPYRPLRITTGRAYRDLADYADGVASLAAAAAPNDDEQTALQQQRRLIRDSIEAARAMVAVARRGAHGEARRGERLLLLVQGADLLFGTLIALNEVLDSAQDAASRRAASAIGVALRRFASSARRVATTIETEPRPPKALDVVTECAAENARTLAQARTQPLVAHAARLLTQLDEYAVVVAVNADGLETGRAPDIPPALAILTIVEDRPSVLDTLRGSLTLSSFAMRHALRVAIVTATAVLVTRQLHLSRDYWVTITAIIILQPYAGATLVKALQRVLGTTAGALITAGLVALIRDPRGLLVVVFVLAAVCVAYLRVNYLIYSVFLTPTFVLLAEMSAGDWHLAKLRVVNTLIGGALGLVGAWVLWPAPERNRFPELAAQALRAAAAHLRLVATMWNHTDDDASAALAAARRDAALAATNAEASFERVVAESARSRQALEPGTTLLAFTRRLIAADIALGTLRHTPEASAIRSDVTRFAEDLTTCLDMIAGAVADRRPPPPCDPEPAASGAQDELTQPQFHRILRQYAIVRAAAARLAAAP